MVRFIVFLIGKVNTRQKGKKMMRERSCGKKIGECYNYQVTTVCSTVHDRMMRMEA